MRCERRHRPDCGHFGGHPHPELLIQIAMIGVIAAILLPGWISEFHKGKACVDLLARGGAGACPLTGKPYAPGDVAACEKDHLPSSPRFPRQGGPPEQTLPAATGTDPVQVRPSFFWRWIAAPVLMTVCLLMMGGCAIFVLAGWRTALIPVLALLTGALALWVCARSAWTSQTLEASKGRVVHRRWILGVERAPLVYEGATAVVPVQTRPSEVQAVLVHGRQATPLAFMTLEDVARLDALLR
jgi:hypothetical protein